MNDAATEPWIKAVRAQNAGNTYYITLEHVRLVNHSDSTDPVRSNYELIIVDAERSRAWHSSFTYQDIHDAVLQEHMAELRALEVDVGLANCLSGGALSFKWADESCTQLYISALYTRFELAPVPLRLPPEGSMQMQQAQDFNKLNACVLDLLLKQNTRLQAQSMLQALQLQTLTSHVQKVHDSYSDAVASIAANLVCEHVNMLPQARQPAVAAASPGSAAKRTRLEEAAGASLGQVTNAADAAATLGSMAADTAPQQQQQRRHQSPAAQAQILPATSPASVRHNQTGQQLAAVAVGGHAAASQANGSGRQLFRTPSKGKSRQLSSEEKLKQRIVTTQHRLQQDWEGSMLQLLRAQDVTEAQQLVAAGSSRLQQQQQSVQALAVHDGRLLQTQEVTLQPQVLSSQFEAGQMNATGCQPAQQQQGAAGAMLGIEQPVQQQAAPGNTAAAEEGDGDFEEEPAVVVHKARGRSRAVGGALAGLRKR